MRSNKYKDYLKRSFIRYAVAIILLMFILFTVFMCFNIQLTTVRANRSSNEQISEFFASQYRTFYHAADQMALDPVLYAAAAKPDSSSITRANQLLYGFATSQSLDSAFILIDTQGQVRCTNLFKGNIAKFCQSTMIQNVIEKLHAAPDAVYSCVSRLDYDLDQKCDLLFAKAVSGDSGVAGYLFFDLRDAGIHDFIRGLQADEVTVTDRFDNILFTTSRFAADPMEKYPTGKYQLDWKSGNTVLVNGKRYHAQASALPESGIQVYTLSSIELQSQIFLYGGVFLTIMSILLITMVLLITDMVTRHNLRSIDELVATVEKLGQGNVDCHIEVQTYDEFQTLYNAFNRLMSRLQEMMKNNNKLAERKRLMEVKHLEQQFNPHFVFNVMEALRYEIVIDPPRASDMVVSFANLMRYSINYGNTKVTLQTDIEYINDYLLLQKMRYNRRLEYKIDIDEELLSCKIPKLLIQPVVENSLNHGAEKTRFIRVLITGRRVEDHLELYVEDNGGGIPPSRLEEIRRSLEDENANSTHIGLYNVHRVLQLLYGPEYGLTIESECQKGTKVTLKILMEMGDENV